MENRKTIDDECRGQRGADSLGLKANSPWPHRLAWIVACGVFPLISWGGMVTTYKAGMAVPDWPTTRGSWFYPLQKWVWDVSSELFLEHGHRTVGQLVGLTAIFLLIAVFRCDRRKSARRLAIAILGGLIFQGTLGGFRVLSNKVLWAEIIFARVHGCTAPLVFCLCGAMVTITSDAWRSISFGSERKTAASDSTKSCCAGAFRSIMLWLGRIFVATVYLEIVFGVMLRHPPNMDDIQWFGSSWLWFWIWPKLITVGVLFLGLIGLGVLVVKKLHPRLVADPIAKSFLDRRMLLLATLFILQVALGCTTWIANYGWPKWFTDNFFNWNYTVVKEGLWQSWITTAHAVVGSLFLVAAVNLAIWSGRLLPRK